MKIDILQNSKNPICFLNCPMPLIEMFWNQLIVLENENLLQTAIPYYLICISMFCVFHLFMFGSVGFLMLRFGRLSTSANQNCQIGGLPSFEAFCHRSGSAAGRSERHWNVACLEVYTSSVACYATAKMGVRMNVTGAKAILEDLRKGFEQKGNRE